MRSVLTRLLVILAVLAMPFGMGAMPAHASAPAPAMAHAGHEMTPADGGSAHSGMPADINHQDRHCAACAALPALPSPVIAAQPAPRAPTPQRLVSLVEEREPDIATPPPKLG